MADAKAIRANRTSTMSFVPSSMLTVRVGKEPEHKDFLAHETFLTSRSEFFRRAMNGNWKESDTRIVRLPEDNPEIFELYLHYVYTGMIATMKLESCRLAQLERAEFLKTMSKEYELLFPLYVVAEKLQDVAAKNATIKAIFDVACQKMPDGTWRLPPDSSIAALYEGTPDGSPARRLAVDLWSNAKAKVIVECESSVPKAFLVELLVAVKEAWGTNKGSIARAKGVKSYLETLEGADSAAAPSAL